MQAKKPAILRMPEGSTKFGIETIERQRASYDKGSRQA